MGDGARELIVAEYPVTGLSPDVIAELIAELGPLWQDQHQAARLTARPRRRAAGASVEHKLVFVGRLPGSALTDLAEAVDEVLLGLGHAVTRAQRMQYAAYQRLRNFARVCPPQQTKLLVYLRADPKAGDLVPGFTRDVT
ncbi:hypothetical protein M878_00875 [Streptomyces roseochromogenus subsp. oscitans DS 12.976]|uniref:Uncharacterized protein n=1 Tax=Streptomyces roseochromogenus subsp. oscitans DS 12.976 TaxID=1352936 RepID=V6KX15_STRRC|nr:hypothetical protein M878_00875 [Streptomyces roseochromogenus subsp. oscitans DS 12.976]